MLPLEDSRLLKPAKSSVAAPSPLQTKPPSAPRVHSSSAPSSAYQAYRQGERDSYSASKPKPSAHPHLPSGHISSPPQPAVRKESEWSPADEKLAIRRAQNQLKTSTPAKPSKPLVTPEDDARETRRFHNQVAAARQPSAPPRVYPANFIGPIAPGARRAAPSNPAPGPARNLPTARHTSGSANAAERHDPDFNVVSGVTKGIIFGNRKPSHPSGSVSPPPPPLPTPEAWAEQQRQIRQVGPPRTIETNAAIGRMTEEFWSGHWQARQRAGEIARVTDAKTTWKDAETGKSLIPRRLPDGYIQLNNGEGVSRETKATPDAAQSATARRQMGIDNRRISEGATLGNKKTGPLTVDHAILERGLPILGPGGNTALLPGEIQKHAMITPRDTSRVTRVLENTRVAQGIKNSRISQSVEQGLAKGPLRIAGRAALPLAAAIDAYDLTKTYQQDGFGPKFRSEAAGVAGGWGTAFAAGAAGTAICGPLCGIAAGAGGYLVGSGAASKLEEGAEELGKGAVEEGKKLWHKVFG